MPHTSDTRVAGYEPLLSPAALLDELPLSSPAEGLVEQSRAEVRAVLDGADDRLLVVAGPCSVHDPAAGLDYARLLAALRDSLAGDLLIVMRVYFEKPRTVTGWKGLINDPGMDGSHDMHRGLRLARRFLLDVTGLGPAGGLRVAGPDHPAVHRGHRDLGRHRGAHDREPGAPAAGLRPVHAGRLQERDRRGRRVAVDAFRAAATGHTFFGVTRAGAAAVVNTTGNPDCHVILRGGRPGPNYQAEHVGAALERITEAGLARRVMVDASHGNSGKDYRRQPAVAADLAGQIGGGEPGIIGVMLESFLLAGRQEPGDRPGWPTGRASPTRAWTSTPPRRCCAAWPGRSAAAAATLATARAGHRVSAVSGATA